MIRVRFRQPRVKSWRDWRQACQLKLAALKAQGGPPYEIDEDLYKQCRDLLFAPYSDKCAYCEGKLFAQSSGQVEHFRPKRGVRDLNNKVMKVGRKGTHPGYWWLAYDPNNLLPACSMCNVYSRKTGGKGERFPLPEKGFVATKPGEEKKEKPLLIHPGQEDPSKLFDVEFDTGALIPKNKRAEICIKVLGLNREKLLEERLQAGMNATLYIKESRNKNALSNRYKKILDDQLAGKLPYSLVWRKVNEQMTPKRKRSGRSAAK